jgi:hypothetical protein
VAAEAAEIITPNAAIKVIIFFIIISSVNVLQILRSTFHNKHSEHKRQVLHSSEKIFSAPAFGYAAVRQKLTAVLAFGRSL